MSASLSGKTVQQLLLIAVFVSMSGFLHVLLPSNLFAFELDDDLDEILQGTGPFAALSADVTPHKSLSTDFTPSFLSRKFYSLMAFRGRRIEREGSDEILERPFLKHVRDAIRINQERAAVYMELSDGSSAIISERLILLEYAIIPFARLLDKKALKYIERGIPVLIDDFVSMDSLNAPEEISSYRGTMTEDIVSSYVFIISEFRKDIFKLARKKHFTELEAAAKNCLTALRTLERETACSFAMGKHLVESIVLCTTNGIRFRAMSNGDTDGIVATNIILQGIGLFPLCDLDVQSASLHRDGIGIIINDLPQIIPQD
jgi:hypothetical protein